MRADGIVLLVHWLQPVVEVRDLDAIVGRGVLLAVRILDILLEVCDLLVLSHGCDGFSNRFSDIADFVCDRGRHGYDDMKGFREQLVRACSMINDGGSLEQAQFTWDVVAVLARTYCLW